MIIDISLYRIGGRGGVEEAVYTVCKGLEKKGHRVRIFIEEKPSYEKFLSKFSEVYIYGNETGKDGENLDDCSIRYAEILQEIGLPNVTIAAHMPMQSYICYKALKYCSDVSPLIISWIHSPLSFFTLNEPLRLCKGHLAISSSVADEINQVIGDGKVRIVGNPIELENIDEVKRTKDKLRLLCIGRIDAYKNIKLLFSILSKVNTDFELTVIGDGSLVPVLKLFSKTLGIEGKIKWLGWLDDPWSEVKEASLLISTSIKEGFGLVIAEALARGIPVIATDSGGPKDFVNRSNGWLIKDFNEDECIEIINKIGKNILELPSAIKCKESIKRYESKKVIKEIEDFILEFIND